MVGQKRQTLSRRCEPSRVRGIESRDDRGEFS